jgi:hypothetical protein
MYDLRFTIGFHAKTGREFTKYDLRFTVYDWFSRKDAAEQRREALCAYLFLAALRELNYEL